MSQVVNEQAFLVSNECVGPNLYLAILESPVIASTVLPGQFVHLQVPGMNEHILRRPFSVYSCDSEQGTIDILYQVVGYGSKRMTTLSPDNVGDRRIELMGPIGNTWKAYDEAALGKPGTCLLVGGGVGAAPLFMLARKLIEAGCTPDVVIGAQTESALVTRSRYEELLGCEPFCATDDGTYGRAGFCTYLVQERLDGGYSKDGSNYDGVAVCGPPPLMKIVAGMAHDAGVFCEVSLERLMACGIGACLSCVAETSSGKKRVCKDGPIFDASEVIW